MPDKIPLSLVTPESVVWEGLADSLIVPARDGQLGVLPHHAPLLAELAPGVVKIKEGENTKLLAVSGGFIEVFNGKASIFAETAEMGEEIDQERARQAVERAKAALKSAGAETLDLAQAQAALRRALVRLKFFEMARRGGRAPSVH